VSSYKLWPGRLQADGDEPVAHATAKQLKNPASMAGFFYFFGGDAGIWQRTNKPL